jgi:hypothetical protein
MKNQYFGDVNDYQKYGLLRILGQDCRIRTGICWMLTAPDQRNDGRKVEYLLNPEKWRHHDRDLFEFLREKLVLRKIREVAAFETSGLLGTTTYFSDLLTDRKEERKSYFQRMLASFSDRDLIFFDPDNGLEVRSTPLGRKNSAKYLYYEEVRDVYRTGKSVLIFQHFARENREMMIERLSNKIRTETGARTVLSYRTSNVAYILLSQPKHVRHFRARNLTIAETWGERITVSDSRNSDKDTT